MGTGEVEGFKEKFPVKMAYDLFLAVIRGVNDEVEEGFSGEQVELVSRSGNLTELPDDTKDREAVILKWLGGR